MTKIQKNGKHQILARNLEQLELSFVAGKNAKWAVSLADSLTISYEAKHAI